MEFCCDNIFCKRKKRKNNLFCTKFCPVIVSRKVSTFREHVFILGKCLCCALCIIFAGNSSSKARLNSTEILAVYYMLLLTTKKSCSPVFFQTLVGVSRSLAQNQPGFMFSPWFSIEMYYTENPIVQ